MHPPAFDRHAPQPAPQPLAHTQQHSGYFAQEPQRAGRHDPASQHSAPAQNAPDPRRGTFDQWPAQPDPRGYDLGSYMPAGQPQQPLDQWSGHDPYPVQPVDPAGRYDPAFGRPGVQGQLQPTADTGYQADAEEDEPEEGGRGRRGLMVVGALVGAIALGGGLAFGYKTFLASPPKTAATPPTVKNQAAPVKTKPADPGGRQFANQDSKVLGRLGEDGDISGVKKVSTLQVGRDGSITAATPQPPPSPPQPVQGTTAVPGLFLDPGPQRAAQAALPAPAAPPAQAAAAAPRQPVIQSAPAAAPPAPAAPAAAAPKKQVVAAADPQAAAGAAPTTKAPAKKAKPRDDHAAAGQTAAPAAATAPAAPPAALGAKSASGFVAVLASRPSQMDALKTIADLQQKYPSQLANKIVTVQEADLTAQGKGIVHRVIVGPPGSRELAGEVCGQIKSAGHKDCWLTAY
jgi:hypothetical protein